jgi:hypothetical protein
MKGSGYRKEATDINGKAMIDALLAKREAELQALQGSNSVNSQPLVSKR